MADTIAVMNGGQVEQLGEPAELYDRPRTEFVAGFLGVSNLLRGTVTAPDRVRIEAGDELSVPLAGRTGDVAIGVRPEKFRLGPPLEGENTLSGHGQGDRLRRRRNPVHHHDRRRRHRRLRPEPRRRPAARARVRRAAQLEPRIDVRPRPSAKGDCGMNRSLTRKQLLERAALGGAALTLPGFLAACGGGGGETARGDDGRQAARGSSPTCSGSRTGSSTSTSTRRRRSGRRSSSSPRRRASRWTTSRTSTTTPRTSARSSARSRRASRSTATSSSSPTTRASPGS